jgi:hypothetical protein
MVNSVTKGGTQKNVRLSKPTDVTIHWKALEEHFLMVPFKVFDSSFNHFGGKNAFSEFFAKNLRP